MEVGKKYDAEVKIKHGKATFKLDGKKYYSCKLKEGDIAEHGRIGFTKFSGDGRASILDFKVCKK